MALLSVFDWVKTPASNTDVNNVGISGGDNVSSGDDAMRSIMALVSQYNRDLVGLGQTIGGTANAITVTINQAWASLADGQILAIKNTGGPNTAATTLAVTNSAAAALGTKKVRLQGDSALSGGEMLANGIYLLRYVASYDSAAGAWALLNSSSAGLPASDTVSGIMEVATGAEFQVGTDYGRAVSPKTAYDAAAEVTLTDAATVAVDMSTFINAKVTLGGNRTLGQPSNTKVGQAGAIRIIQDGTGSRTLAFHSDWKFAFGADPVVSTTAAATDILYYQVIAANVIVGSLVKGIA